MSELPLSHSQTLTAAKWLTDNFAQNIDNKTQGTHFTSSLIKAIACQETAYKWLLWLKYEPSIILARCVFDASGDFPNTTRSAFPKNAAAFHDKYGDIFTDMLIHEGNLQRAMPQAGNEHGWSAAHYLYKGYGIFQYDLQAVVSDEAFFKEKLWYNIDECLDRCIKELNAKYHGDLWDCVKHYNGSGAKAEQYANNVRQFNEWILAM